MLSVELSDIATAKVVPCDDDIYGVAYTTKDGRDGTDSVGTRSQAEAIVRQVEMAQGAPTIFPKDIAAS